MSSLVLAGPCLWEAVDEPMWNAMRIWAECEHSSSTLAMGRASLLQSWLGPLASASGSEPWAAMLVGILVLRHNVVHGGLIRGDAPRQVQRRVTGTVGKALGALERGFKTTGAGPGRRTGEAPGDRPYLSGITDTDLSLGGISVKEIGRM